MTEMDILNFNLEVAKRYKIEFKAGKRKMRFSILDGHKCKVIANYSHVILFERNGSMGKIRECINKVDFLTNVMGCKEI